MIRFLIHAVAAALGLWIASRIIPGVHVGGTRTLLLAGLLLGVVNAIVRPILILLTLPFTILTLGLFLLIVNGLMVSLVAFFIRDVHLGGFINAVLVSIIITLTSWIVGGCLMSLARR